MHDKIWHLACGCIELIENDDHLKDLSDLIMKRRLEIAKGLTKKRGRKKKETTNGAE